MICSDGGSVPLSLLNRTAAWGEVFPTVAAIIDFSQAALKDKPTNVEGLLFKENEAGYLAGFLAGNYAKANDIDTIST